MSTTMQSLHGETPDLTQRRGLALPFGLTPTSLALAGIVLLAAALRFANIGAIGESNTYYTAAVKAMLQSWHNFFFAAAEPGGSVSVDKPPVAYWVQTLSAAIFGVNGFAVVLPQILAGIGSVLVLFHLVRRSFGNVAGLVAAFALAVTPVAIAVDRNNTPDGLLIFTLLLAAWAFLKATESRQLRYLLLGAVLVGVGFNIKMMQAALPLPAFYALYFFGSRQVWWRKLAHLALATLVLVPVALSWAVAVDLTPADQRPYVGSSTTNSELELMFGYNGLQRLLGRGMGGQAPSGQFSTARNGNTTTPPAGSNGQTPALPNGAAPNSQGFVPPQNGFGGPGGPGGAGGMFGTGQPGLLRLFQSGLAAQVSWLLPFGLLMLIPTAASVSWWRPRTALHRGLLLWGGWLVTCVVFFSIAGFFHQYYLAMMGAPLAALVAIGITFLWRLRRRRPGRAALLLLVAAAVTLAFQVYAVRMYMTSVWWLALPAALGIAGLARLLTGLRRQASALPRAAFGLLSTALLVVPTVWSGLTTAYASGGGLPQAYGETRGIGGIGGNRRNAVTGSQQGSTTPGAPPMGGTPGDVGGRVNQALLSYLEAHTQDTTYLMVVPSSMAGSEYVLATGRPVLYAGGFSGSDPVIDGTKLAQLVAKGEVRYVLWGGGGPGGRGDSATSITSYLQSSCKVVDDASLGTATGGTSSQTTGGGFGFGRGPGGASTLYQCGS